MSAPLTGKPVAAPESENAKHWWDFTIGTSGALIGTVAGASVAFWIERRKRAREIEDRHVESANVAIFNLIQIYAYLQDYQHQVIDRHPNNSRQWYDISRVRLQAPELQPFDVRSLAFLFETEYKNLVNRIALDLIRYQGLLSHIAMALKYNDEVQQIARMKPTASAIELEVLCGQVLVEQVRAAVNSIIEFLTKLTPTVGENTLELSSAVKKMYPDRTIIHFEDASTPERLPWYRYAPRSIW